MSVSTKPASGFRDYLPADARRRREVFGVIEDVFQTYGFEPLDTPAVERLDTLLGKYGDEGDQLVFKLLKRGEKLSKALNDVASDGGDLATETQLADLGLRYDLTVPLARVVAQYKNDLPNIWKRYQIAPVWRADRPQRGRFREFYQCDVDVVGSRSMVVEAEVCAALSSILRQLGFEGFRIQFNHRLLLAAIMELCGVPKDLEGTALVAIDKFDKIGLDGVRGELAERGLSEGMTDALLQTVEQLDGLSSLTESADILDRIAAIESGAKALDDLRAMHEFSQGTPASEHLRFDPLLARGLSYYTGPVFEIRSDDFPGSLGGGGRYDDLVGMFSRESIPACGFSLGVERILVLLEERGVDVGVRASADVLLTLYDRDSVPGALGLAAELRAEGVRVDVFPEPGKYKKQFKHADSCGIPFAIVVGPREREAGVVALKNLASGEQQTIARESAAAEIAQLVRGG